MSLILSDSFYIKFAYNTRFTVARWLYVFLGIVSAIYIGEFVDPALLPAPINTGLLMAFFFIVAFLNIGVYLITTHLEKDPEPFLNNLLAICQVAFDLLIISALYYLLGGRQDVVSVLYFIPVIEGIVLFGFYGAISTALASGFLLNYVVFILPNINTFAYYLELAGITFTSPNNLLSSTTISFAIIYLILAAFLSYHFVPIRGHKVGPEIKAKFQIKNNVIPDSDKPHNHPEQFKMAREVETTQLEVNMLKEDLKELELAKTKFISVTAHQLRTPLAAIKWTFNMLLAEDSSLNREEREVVAKGQESTQRMIGIVNNLLHVDNIDAKHSDYNMTKIDLAEVVEKIMSEFDNHLLGKKIELIFDKPEKELPQVTADPMKLRIVLENLIDNAIKYTPMNGRVTISISDDKINSANPMLELSVADTGIGVPDDQQDKLFGKFFRATNAVSYVPDGSGIGLYISKDIAEKHGGSLRFDSEEGKGTTFYLSLPINQSNQDGTE